MWIQFYDIRFYWTESPYVQIHLPCINCQFYHKNILQHLLCIHGTQAIVSRAGDTGLAFKYLESHCHRKQQLAGVLIKKNIATLGLLIVTFLFFGGAILLLNKLRENEVKATLLTNTEEAPIGLPVLPAGCAAVGEHAPHVHAPGHSVVGKHAWGTSAPTSAHRCPAGSRGSDVRGRRNVVQVLVICSSLCPREQNSFHFSEFQFPKVFSAVSKRNLHMEVAGTDLTCPSHRASPVPPPGPSLDTLS